DVVLAVAFLDVASPNLLAGEVKASQVPRPNEGPDVGAIHAAGRTSFVGLDGSIATNHVPGRNAERALPQDLALGADAKEHQVLVPAVGQEEMVVPDSRRASPHARK